MKLVATMFCLVILVSGCSAGALLIPATVIPTSNYLTRDHYEDKYEEYDASYRESVSFAEHTVPRGDHTIYAREFGGDDNNKPVIVLMHGFPDSLHLYDQLAPLLADHFRVISFDFLGWGASDKPADHTYNSASLYQDLDTVIAYFNLDKVSLVVHDASGPPGIEWALNNPERMDTLVLLNTYYHRMLSLVSPEAIATFSTPGAKRLIIRSGARLSNYGWRSGYQNQMERFFYDENQKKIMLPILTHQAMDIRNAFFQLNGVLNQEAEQRADNVQRLHDYKGPVKIIFGSEDPYLNKEVAQEFYEIFQNSELYLIEQAAHFVQLDNPEGVARGILKPVKLVQNQKDLN